MDMEVESSCKNLTQAVAKYYTSVQYFYAGFLLGEVSEVGTDIDEIGARELIAEPATPSLEAIWATSSVGLGGLGKTNGPAAVRL